MSRGTEKGHQRNRSFGCPTNTVLLVQTQNGALNQTARQPPPRGVQSSAGQRPLAGTRHNHCLCTSGASTAQVGGFGGAGHDARASFKLSSSLAHGQEWCQVVSPMQVVTFAGPQPGIPSVYSGGGEETSNPPEINWRTSQGVRRREGLSDTPGASWRPFKRPRCPRALRRPLAAPTVDFGPSPVSRHRNHTSQPNGIRIKD